MSGDKTNILAVCGTSVATSTVVREALKESLPDYGIEIGKIDKATATEAPGKVSSGNFDLVVTTTALSQDRFDIPVIHTTAFMTGIGEEKAMEEIAQALKSS